MRLRKLFLSLAIIAVLMVIIMPSNVFAAPPKGETHLHNWYVVSDTATCVSGGQITWRCSLCGEYYSEGSPATGVHTPVTVWGKAATCTEPGLSNGSKCSVCGTVLKKQQTIPAKGHDWDEGIVTEECNGFVAGVKTYTCKNDSSHTYTALINPAPNLFDLLRDINPTSGEEGDPLVVTLQPEDGWITRGSGETHLFTIAVEGGVGSYTYEWHSRPVDGEEETTTANPITYSVSDLCTYTADTFYSLGVSWDTALTAEWKDTEKSTWLQSVEDVMTWGKYDDKVQQLLESLDPTVKNFGPTDGPTYSASEGDRLYWCEITDEAKDSVLTYEAIVRYKLRIASQPGNRNLDGKSEVSLSCEAADGLGANSYVYIWYNEAGEEVGTGWTVPVSEEGKYYCVVTDGVTTVESDKCTVYSCEPFQIVDMSEEDVQWKGAFGEIYATFSGGVKPYQFMWLYDGAEIETLYERDEGEFVTVTAETEKAGPYTIVAVDAMGSRLHRTIYRREKGLRFKTAPEGGVASKLKPLYLTAELDAEDVKLPVTYQLICNGKVYTARNLNRYTISFPVHYAGEYNILAIDAAGHEGETDQCVVTEPDFHIAAQSEDSHLTVQGEPVELFVEVEGGREPYKYQWIVYYGSLMHKFADTPSVKVYDVGTYGCRVLDATGKSVRAKVIKVDYTGGPPWIYLEPQDQTLPISADGKYEFILSCAAKSGSGAYDRLDYQWYTANMETKTIDPYRVGLNVLGTKLGVYGCEVTDQRNGESAYSRGALVDSEMEFVYEATDVGKQYNTIVYHVKGGCGPYHIKVSTVYDMPGGMYTLFYKEQYVENYDYSDLLTVDKNTQYTVERNGTLDVYKRDAQYVVVVTDVYGQECTSDILS